MTSILILAIKLMALFFVWFTPLGLIIKHEVSADRAPFESVPWTMMFLVWLLLPFALAIAY